MPRRKVKIKRIENGATRQITFSKRRAGLFKKAHDLSVLCDAKVAVIVFSEKGRLFEFASPSAILICNYRGGDVHHKMLVVLMDIFEENPRSINELPLRVISLS